MEECSTLSSNLFIQFILANQLNILSAVTAISDPPGIRSTEFATPNSCSVIVKFNDKSSGFGYDLRTGISTADGGMKRVAYW